MFRAVCTKDANNPLKSLTQMYFTLCPPVRAEAKSAGVRRTAAGEIISFHSGRPESYRYRRVPRRGSMPIRSRQYHFCKYPLAESHSRRMRRMASERVGASICWSANLSSASPMSSASRTPVIGVLPVAGLPLVLCLTLIDFDIFMLYTNCSSTGRSNLPPTLSKG